MLFSNVPITFSTDPGGKYLTSETTKGMSRYYVYRDGLVRVKFQDGFATVHYGKNICYTTGQNVRRDSGDTLFFFVDDTPIRYCEALAPGSPMRIPAFGKKTIDFFLDGERYREEGRFHYGHVIAEGFAATKKGKAVNVFKLDEAVKRLFGSPLMGHAMTRIAGAPMLGQASTLVPIDDLGDIT